MLEEALVAASGMPPGHTSGCVPGVACILSVGLLVVLAGAGVTGVLGRVAGCGERRRRGVAPGVLGWDDLGVVRVTDVAKRRRQGLVACRAALPLVGLLDARPGVAPAPPFGAVVRQSAIRRR